MSWVLAKGRTAACLQCNPALDNRVTFKKNAYTDTSEKKKTWKLMGTSSL